VTFDVRTPSGREEYGRAIYPIGQSFGGRFTEEELGRFEQRHGALARADALFGWRPLPRCPEIF
jgi:hypothetical protein